MSTKDKQQPGWGQFLGGLGALKTGPGALVAKEWEKWLGDSLTQLNRAQGLGKQVLQGLEKSGAMRVIADRVSQLTPDTGEVQALKARINELEATVQRLNTPAATARETETSE